MSVNIELHNMGPQAMSLPALSNGESYIVYKQSGLSEAAIHPFVRIVPALGVAMQKTSLPLSQVDKAAKAVSMVVSMVQGKVTMKSVLELYEFLTQK